MFGVHKQINTVIEWIHLLVPLDGLCFFGYLQTVFKMSIISTDTNNLDGFKADIITFTQYEIKHRSYPFGKLITAIYLVKKALSLRNKGLIVPFICDFDYVSNYYENYKDINHSL